MESISELFTFSPFGLCCRQCKTNLVTIKLDERPIRDHLKKHNMDSRMSTVRTIFEGYKSQLAHVKASGTIEQYRIDMKTYSGLSCLCGQSFIKKSNAIRHCQRLACDVSKLKTVELLKLCCGRFVTQAQVDTLFTNTQPHTTQQFNYSEARAVLLPFLPQREKQDHTYTHMYVPLISGCGGAIGLQKKSKLTLCRYILHHVNLWSPC
jgi:hypothetical protein